MHEQKRENWGSKIGLIMAMAGNAIGLGNFWRFPNMAASNGGGAFMIPYFAALLLIGFPLMITEWHMGRTGGKHNVGTIGPMVYLQTEGAVKKRRTAVILGTIGGAIAFSVCLLVNSYYTHIIGWTIDYAALSAVGTFVPGVDSIQIFLDTTGNPLSLIGWVVGLGLMIYTVSRGIQKGIESWAKIMMPLLYVIAIALIVMTFISKNPTNPDWTPIAGLNYLWSADFSKITPSAITAAAGQIFFTLSLGMGIICNYASYLKPKDDIVVSSVTTMAFNEFAEVILASTIVIPLAYTFLGPQGTQSAGAGLAFMTLPNAFLSMPSPLNSISGTLWFLLLFAAGFTSAIAMYNYITTILVEDGHFKRTTASILTFLGYIVVGAPIALEFLMVGGGSTVYLDETDKWIGTYILLILGLIEIISVAWIAGKKRVLPEINSGAKWKISGNLFSTMFVVIAPLLLIFIVISSTIDMAGFNILNPGVPSKNIFAMEHVPEGMSGWAWLSRGVIIAVLIAGAIISYRSIKRRYLTPQTRK